MLCFDLFQIFTANGKQFTNNFSSLAGGILSGKPRLTLNLLLVYHEERISKAGGKI